VLPPQVSGGLTIALSGLMMLLGLQMLALVPPISRLVPILPRGLLHRVHDLVDRRSRSSASLLGAATFFLPCGFTLALQLYVLAKADALTGALTMLVFALGTLPALLSLSVLSSLTRGWLQSGFLKAAGAAVIILGLLNIQYGLQQVGRGGAQEVASTPVMPARSDAVLRQVVDMKIVGLEYQPNRFVVKAGVPVEWRIDARDAEGCGRILISRSLGLAKFLSSDNPNVVTFTPGQPGEIAFNCSMEMMSPNSGFTVVN